MYSKGLRKVYFKDCIDVIVFLAWSILSRALHCSVALHHAVSICTLYMQQMLMMKMRLLKNDEVIEY